jgi:RHS repeat-associated protein
MSTGSVARFFLLWGLVLALGSVARAQVVTGTPPFGSFSGGPDIINLASLNSHITIPIVNKAGRGTSFNYNLTYDSSVWYPVTTGGVTTWTPVVNWGWGVQTAPITGEVTATTTIVTCTTTLSNWVFHDASGVPHPFGGTAVLTSGTCGSSSTPVAAIATDGSGYTLVGYVGGPVTVTSRAGKVMTPPLNSSTGAGTFTDANGNQISVNSTGVSTDTLGQTALTVAGGTSNNPWDPSSALTLSYVPPGGGSASYTINSIDYTVSTNFGVPGIIESGKVRASLPNNIVLPDGTQYTFTYETTPGKCELLGLTHWPNCVTGRLASITLPTGGTISYTYSGVNNGILPDGSTATLGRTTPDGSWTYAHTESGTAWTTTVTDPQSNNTTMNFQGIYETERQVNQGASTLLKTIYTCYNGNATPSACNSTAVALPITERTVFKEWPSGGLQSRSNAFYNASGLVTETDEYAYGPGAPGAIVRKTLTTYASLGNGIVNKPASVIVEDGSGNVKAKTTYCYDEATPSGTATCSATGAPTATSGTSQHVAVTGSRGNLTTIASVVSGTTTLGKTYTYYDTGNVLTATDVNGAQTTFSYGPGACPNSFPVSVTEPLSLTRTMGWNCIGGVEIWVGDENNKTINVEYVSDPDYWRPTDVVDQESHTTFETYSVSSAGIRSVESSLSFNGSVSTSDALTTQDSLGRTHVSQRKQSPSSSEYDSVETDYDSLGRPSRTTLPYQATGGTTNSSAPGTATTYDALSRKLLVKDSETTPRTVTFAYNQNDTYRTLSPAPTGENTKRKQFEYDALGRLTSVCEITSATGSGACAQTSAATGYWTTYSYDLNNNLIGVTQNAQSSGSRQTRTYAYDDLGRMTSETNPESGTTTYTFDTDTTCGTSKGDLVKKIDAVGNTTCIAYDSLHRPTSVTYSGPYSSSTPNKYFVYDAATVNGVAMANVKARMAEAYTATTPTGTKITDIGISYSSRGEASDVYESTPHSGGYYHSSGTYWANGALDTLGSNIASLPVFTYAPDGEGRINTVSASAGQNPVTGTTYSVASLPTLVTFGSSDNDSFTYDPATNRMTQYEFTVNSQSVVGALTWNSIGTLEDLSVTDPFFSGGNQSCAYTHDDLSRIASANCGSPWSQTFSYDAFGNISKSGTVSFQPTYNYLTNRMTEVGSSTPTYDANGNAINDTAHTYAWDANARPVTVDAVGLTYDALGRMAEQNRSGVYSQIVYTPLGSKFALMNAQTLTKAFVHLTGGSQAVYTPSGLAYYRHSDWIGSSRFASTPARTMYSDGAYGPFGETYAESGTADLSFTGMNQDTVANLYDFPAREYNDIHGRWPSPDPSGLRAVRIKNPQSWNRYAYVQNSPLSFTDPLGLQRCMLGDTGPVSNECMQNGRPTNGGSTGDGDGDSNVATDGGTGGSIGVVGGGVAGYNCDDCDNQLGDDSPPDITGNPDVPLVCGEAICGPPGVPDPPYPIEFYVNSETNPPNAGLQPGAVDIATMLNSTDVNIGYMGIGMFAADACVYAPTGCISMGLSFIIPFNQNFNPDPVQVGVPETGHPPDNEPNGGSTVPETPPISGPPPPP